MPPSLERANYKATFVVLLLAVTAYSLLQSLVVPVLPTFQRDLHTSQGTVTWLLTVFLLSASIFTPILGRVGDMVGKERMLVVTLLSLATGTSHRRAGPVHRRADRGPGHPGDRRCGAAPLLRDHP